MHFLSCASRRIGRAGRKLKIMTEVTIAPTSRRTAPNPLVKGAHHDNTLLENTILNNTLLDNTILNNTLLYNALHLSMSLSNV